MSVFSIVILCLAIIAVVLPLAFSFREWCISRHNRKVALTYLNTFQQSRAAVRKAAQHEIARKERLAKAETEAWVKARQLEDDEF